MPELKVGSDTSHLGSGLIGTPPDLPVSPVADSANARHVRARTYTTLTAPPDMAVQKLHATTSDYNASASETDGAYPVGTLEGALQFNEIFHHCLTSGKRPAQRAFLSSWKSFMLDEAEAHYKANPDDYIALCYDISDYEECFWNYRTNAYCTPEEAEQFDEVLEQVFATKGSFLDEAVQDKTTSHFTAACGASVATTSMQGWRSANEDAHVLEQLQPGCLLTAILDGHGGSRVAEHCARHLARHVAAHLPDIDFSSKPATSAARSPLQAALQAAFLAVDDDVETNMNPDHYGAAGTTLNALLLTPHHYVVANTGDSRLIVIREAAGTASVERLSHDHKPDSPREQARITEAGGHVSDGRVEGLLAVSRALGDFDFKQAGGLDPCRQEVTAFPDVELCERRPEDIAVLQACDGIWDCMSDAEVGDFVVSRLQKGLPHTEIAEAICNHCLAPEICESGLGTDNMSLHLLVMR